MKARTLPYGLLRNARNQIIDRVSALSPDIAQSVRLSLSKVSDIVLLIKCLRVFSSLQSTHSSSRLLQLYLHVLLKHDPNYKKAFSTRVWCTLEKDVTANWFHVPFSDDGDYSEHDIVNADDHVDNGSFETATTEPVSDDDSDFGFDLFADDDNRATVASDVKSIHTFSGVT